MSTDLIGMHRISLVGREKDIDRVFQIVSSAEKHNIPALVFIQGMGGIGKTALLEEIRNRISHRVDAVIGKNIDLFHLENQTSFGFCSALVDAVPELDNYFDKFKKLLRDFHDAQDHDRTVEANKVWLDAESEFILALSKASKKKGRIWFLLDTAEILDFQQSLYSGKDDPAAEHVAEWLVRVLPKLNNPSLVFLVAGRPSKNLEKSFSLRIRKKLLGWKVENPLDLNPLSPEACRDYLVEVAAYLEKNKVDGAESIRGYLQEYGYQALRRETGGQPLYLAMVSDILKTSGTLPEGFYEQERSEGAENIRSQVLADHFMNLRAPIGLTLRAMAILHKGVDAELLAQVMRINEETAQDFLRRIERLALVKRREGDDPRRWFLHDEVYDLYARRNNYPADTFENIKVYYEHFMKDLDRLMHEHSLMLSRYQSRRQMAKIELMHYTLWFDAWRGFAEYFSQSCSNLSVRIGNWENLLEREFIRTKEWLERLDRFPKELETYVIWDGQIRRVERESIKKENNALNLLESIHEEETTPDFCKAYLWYVRGMMNIRGQKYPATVPDPDDDLKKAENFLRTPLPNEGLKKANQVLKAFVENYFGYVARRAGQYKNAVREYQKAAVLMRLYDLDGLSGVLTNQGYAMSMLGLDRRAQETAREAYEVARKSNSLRDQVRALNVRANAETLAGNIQNGTRMAKQALDTLRLSPEERLEALIYVSLGRSLRYEWNQSLGEANGIVENANYNLLFQSLVYFESTDFVLEKTSLGVELPVIPRGAIDILKDTTDAENLSAARNECGCLWREVAWAFRKRYGENDKRTIDAESLAQSRLEEAAGIQKISKSDEVERLKAFYDLVMNIGGSPYWPALALANLAWHQLYQNSSPEGVEQACKFVEKAIKIVGKENHIWFDHEPDVNYDDADVMLWGALGKMEMARGYTALRSWRIKEKIDEDRLEIAVFHIARALEYNYLIGQTNFNMKRAEIGLENRIRQSVDWQKVLLPRFYKYALEVAPKLGIKNERQPRVLRWLDERYGDKDLWLGGV